MGGQIGISIQKMLVCGLKAPCFRMVLSVAHVIAVDINGTPRRDRIRTSWDSDEFGRKCI